MSAVTTTAEGLELARSLDESLEKILDTEALLEALAADRPLGEERLATIRELGIHGVALGEAEGGLGIGLGDRVRLAAVFGRRLVPAFLRDEAFGFVPALAALAAAGEERAGDLLEAAAAGELGGEVALSRRPSQGDPEPVPMAAAGNAAEWLVVLGAERLELFELGGGGPALEPVAGLDGGQGLARVRLAGATPAASLAGEAAAGLRREYELVLAAEAFGAGERSLELASKYAGERRQFGSPIASFQAVAHLLSEMKLGIETSRAGIGRLVDLAAEPDAAPAALEEWTAVLAHTVPASARAACEGSIQVHGGIGFSWELGLHLSYRRILADQQMLGGESASAERVGLAYLERRSRR